MRFPATALRPAFGCLVIAHGLAHAVLPLRGLIDPASPILRPVLFLYAVAVLGFAFAGLGLLGARPFTALVRPALVLASAYSLITLVCLGQALWWAASLDLGLLLVGVTGVYRRLPMLTEHRPPLRHRASLAVAVALTAYAASAVAFWPLHRVWGSVDTEHGLVLPGDSANRNPALEIQHAVTIDASPEAVWPWLVQLGQDRAGFYSYDWLERAFGVDIHNVTEIRPEWQQRSAGDRVRATQSDYLGGVLGDDLGWTVRQIEPGRALVLQNWGAFVLAPTDNGHTRFIIRTTVGDPSVAAWVAALDMMAFELPHFIMERRMMLRIKSLAESNAAKALS